MPIPGEAQIEQAAVGKHLILAKSVDNRWFAFGRNKLSHVAKEDKTYESFTDVSAGLESLKKHKIV